MLSGWILTAVDRLFLSRYTGLSEVGLYSLGYKLGDIMNIVTASVNYAWVPFFMSTAKEKGQEAKDTFARLTTYYLAVIFFLALMLSVPAREIVAILATAQYQDAHKVVPIIIFGWVFGGMYYMVVNQIFYTKKTRFLPLATFGAGLVQLLLNSVWVPRYGMIGSAWAMLLAQLVSFLFTWYISYRVYPMHFEYARIARAILVTGGLLAASFMINTVSVWHGLLAKTLLLSGYPLLLLVVGFFGQDELLKARGLVSRWLAQRGYSVKS
jgi:O-antigen/teichoic acid export membrane protein